jgi:hypothetical protein
MDSKDKCDEHGKLIASLFFVMSARLQETEQLAVKGEALSLNCDGRLKLAHKIHASVREIETLAEATMTLIDQDGDGELA